jgi:hypothetical protein
MSRAKRSGSAAGREPRAAGVGPLGPGRPAVKTERLGFFPFPGEVPKDFDTLDAEEIEREFTDNRSADVGELSTCSSAGADEFAGEDDNEA